MAYDDGIEKNFRTAIREVNEHLRKGQFDGAKDDLSQAYNSIQALPLPKLGCIPEAVNYLQVKAEAYKTLCDFVLKMPNLTDAKVSELIERIEEIEKENERRINEMGKENQTNLVVEENKYKKQINELTEKLNGYEEEEKKDFGDFVEESREHVNYLNETLGVRLMKSGFQDFWDIKHFLESCAEKLKEIDKTSVSL